MYRSHLLNLASAHKVLDVDSAGTVDGPLHDFSESTAVLFGVPLSNVMES